MEQLTGLRLDARALRVLAHPLRARLLARLRINGPATATTLAQVLDTNSGATSYHLRQLESVGLVTDTGEGAGKQRLWRAATDYHSFHPEDFAGDEEAETSLAWLMRHYVQSLADSVGRWVDSSGSWPLRWREAAGGSDWMIRVTAEQLASLHEELEELVGRYREAGANDPDARRVSLYSWALPQDLDQPPAP